MLVLDQISPRNALIFKATRLQALQDSPLAFGSTYARESQLTDADWSKRAADWCTEKSVGYLAMEQGSACGIIGAFLDQQDPDKAHLISMWVSPAHRQRGIGQALVEAIQIWARMRGANLLQLTVTNSNHTAIEFYRGNGFTMTGNTEPYPNDPTLFEYEMSRSLKPKSS